MPRKSRNSGVVAQSRGTFPLKMGRDTSKRLNPAKKTKGYSSIAQAKGQFPVNLSADPAKRFNPK